MCPENLKVNLDISILSNCYFLFVLQFIVPLENFFLLIWRRHHCRWRAANFDLCSPLMVIEQWGFFTCYTHCDTGLPFLMVISEDPWHSQLLPSVWQWSCHYLFLRLPIVTAVCFYGRNNKALVLMMKSFILFQWTNFNVKL